VAGLVPGLVLGPVLGDWDWDWDDVGDTFLAGNGLR
jgi:hypothetical protein